MMSTKPRISSSNNINLRGAASDIEQYVMANCVKIVNQATQAAAAADGEAADVGRMFTCKTCGRKFNSFQALGGHRASHKKAKSAPSGDDDVSAASMKPKSHACSICGAEFPIGQALGGHMRRHRPLVVAAGSGNGSSVVTTENSLENSDGSCDSESKKRRNDDVSDEKSRPVEESCKRVCLDLNLAVAWMVKGETCYDDADVEEGEIVEQESDHGGVKEEEKEEEYDLLKLELRPPCCRV